MAIKKFKVNASKQAKSIKKRIIASELLSGIDKLPERGKVITKTIKGDPVVIVGIGDNKYMYKSYLNKASATGDVQFIRNLIKKGEVPANAVKNLGYKLYTSSGSVESACGKKSVKASSSLKVKPYVINKGQSGEYYGLKNAEDNQVLHSAPNNWKSERGAINWAKKKGYDVVDSACGKKSVKACSVLCADSYAVKDVAWVKDEYTKSDIVKYPYINVTSGKPSLQRCVIMKAYMSLDDAQKNLKSDSKDFYNKYGKTNWYIADYYGSIATIDNPYYDGIESSKSVKKFGIKASKAAKKRVANKKITANSDSYYNEDIVMYLDRKKIFEGSIFDLREAIEPYLEDASLRLQFEDWCNQFGDPFDFDGTARDTAATFAELVRFEAEEAPEDVDGNSELYVSGDGVRGLNFEIFYKHDEIEGTKKSIKCAQGDFTYDFSEDEFPFRVTLYYDHSQRGIADGASFDNMDEAVEYAHEKLSEGPVRIEHYDVGAVDINPDEYWENFDGEFWCTPELAEWRDEVWKSMGIGASTGITAALNKKSDINDEQYNQALADEVADMLRADGFEDIEVSVAPEAISFFINDEVMFVQPTNMITPNMADIYDDCTELFNAVKEAATDKMWKLYDEENKAMRDAWEDPDINDPDYATRAVTLSRKAKGKDISAAEETIDIDDLDYISGDDEQEDWGYGFDSNGEPVTESMVEELERIAQETLDKSEIHNIDEYADLHNFNYYASIPYIQESFDISFTYVADIYELSKNGMATDEGIYTTVAPYNIHFNVRCENGEVKYAECTDVDVNDGYVKDVELTNFNLDALVQFATDLVNPVATNIYNATTNI